MIQSYKSNGFLIFNLDLDNDDTQSFEFCVNYIKENFQVEIIEYLPPIWNDGKFRFILGTIHLELIWTEFGGTTELRISEKIKSDQLLQVMQIVQTLLTELRKLK